MIGDCLGYVRVSTDRQVGETKSSLADQRAAIDALAQSMGLTVSAWYADEGASGATVEKRPALLRLLADCASSPRHKSQRGYVLVLNDSRWGRFPNPEESAYWRIHLEKLGWFVRFAENDAKDTDKTVRTVMRAIVASQATQKRADVQANAKRGSRGTAEQGFWGSREPFGYRRKVVYPQGRGRVLDHGQRKAPDEKVILTPHDEEASVVRELFRRYASGSETIAHLTEWLLATTSRKWTRAAVRETLRNPAYAGDVVSGRFISDKHDRVASNWRPEREWVIHRDAHPALVSRETFERVQAVLARNKQWTRRASSDWLLTGLVRCPCGASLASHGGVNHRSGAVTRSYRCSTQGSTVSDRCAYRGSVKKEWLEDATVQTIGSFVARQKDRLIAALDRAMATRATEGDSPRAAIERQLADAKASLARLIDAVATGTFSPDEVGDKLNGLRRTIATLDAKRETFAVASQHAQTHQSRRDRLVTLMTDFPTAATTLSGPKLRELLRPWIANAAFDPRDRTLTLDIHHIPNMDLTQMPFPLRQKHTPTTRKRVVVGRR